MNIYKLSDAGVFSRLPNSHDLFLVDWEETCIMLHDKNDVIYSCRGYVALTGDGHIEFFRSSKDLTGLRI